MRKLTRHVRDWFRCRVWLAFRAAVLLLAVVFKVFGCKRGMEVLIRALTRLQVWFEKRRKG